MFVGDLLKDSPTVLQYKIQWAKLKTNHLDCQGGGSSQFIRHEIVPNQLSSLLFCWRYLVGRGLNCPIHYPGSMKYYAMDT